jgi:hypothetical protein
VAESNTGKIKLFGYSLPVTIIPNLVFLFAAIFFVGDSPFSLTDFPLDDAWIHRVYSRSFAFGHGFEYNPGVQEAGSTSPLWSIVSAPAHWLEFLGTSTVVLVIKIIGIFLGMWILSSVLKMTTFLSRSPLTGIIAATLFAMEPRLLFSSLSGMETLLLVALWLGGTYALMKSRWILAAVMYSLMPVARPEALLLLPVAFLTILICAHEFKLRKRLVVGLLLTFPVLLWSLFCFFTNGHIFPNTFYVKAGKVLISGEGFYQAWKAVCQHGYASLLVFLVGLAAFMVWLFSSKRSSRNLMLSWLLAAPFLYLTGVAGTRVVSLDGYYWTRWTDPVSLVITVAFCTGYAVLIVEALSFIKQTYARKLSRTRPELGVSILAILAVVGLLLSLPQFVRSFQDRRSVLASDCKAVFTLNVQAGLWINQNTPADITVGVIDAGAIRYFGKRQTFDLIGLNNQDIAFQRVDLDYIIETCDWLAVFPAFFENTPLLDPYEPQAMFKVPVEEYTISKNPKQAVKMIYRKKAD